VVAIETPHSENTQSAPRTKEAGPILLARDIFKSYSIGNEVRWVLNGIDFAAMPGECVFLVGPSGSGKSTLLSILGCLLDPDRGEIQIDGLSVEQLTSQKRTLIRRKYVGFVFQRFQLINGMSAEDNVAVPLCLAGLTLQDAREQSSELLRRVGLLSHRKQHPTQMSPGQCQRVALARAIIGSPKIIFADEPTASLDEKSGKEIMELLRELIEVTKTATVLVTHDPRIFSYADRVCVIDNGRLTS
jgi:putative ABC transport system ATP-binding protein